MALDATAVRVGVTGRVYFAPPGTTVPTSVTGSLNAAFKDVGYATDAGVTFGVSVDSNDIKAWQGGVTVRRVQTGVTYTLAFTMLETNENTLELFFNNFTHGAGAADGTVDLNSDQPYRGAFVVDVVDDDQLLRYVVPDGQVSDRGDVSIVNGDAISYSVTVTAYPDANGSAGKVYTEATAAS